MSVARPSTPRDTLRFLGLLTSVVVLMAACTGPPDSTPTAEQEPPVYSAFGEYTELPSWSTWCRADADPACAAQLQLAVSNPSADSRPTVRGHGWKLWAASWSEIQADGHLNDASVQRTNLYGTSGCWTEVENDVACSGVYPIWLTWPNNGKPFEGTQSEIRSDDEFTITSGDVPAETNAALGPLLAINRSHKMPAGPAADPNPTLVQTVHTEPHPVYQLPPLVLSKGCGIPIAVATSLLQDSAYQAIDSACRAAGAEDLFCGGDICDGTAFVNEGNVMIATESLSQAGYQSILSARLHLADTLGAMYARERSTIAPLIDADYISTKHMFWPVKGCRPGTPVGEPGCRVRYGALPPWVPSDFNSLSYATNSDYLGYEEWESVVAIDTCTGTSERCPGEMSATLELAYAYDSLPDGLSPLPSIRTVDPAVYSVGDFLHVQVSEEALSNQFTPTDRALLDQATIWAYGDDSHGFEAGDFLVVVAMHINTKELPSWTFQSVWWSPMTDALSDCPLDDYDHCFGQSAAYGAMSEPGGSIPNGTSGLLTSDIDSIDAQVGTAWRDFYVLTDSYGIRYELDGTPVTVDNYFQGRPPTWATTGPSGDTLASLPVSQNVYIEPVIHPLGTNCQNCHRRAGYVPGQPASGDYPEGVGRTGYQTAQCAYLLGDYGSPMSDPCMTEPWAWFSEGGSHCREVDGLLCRAPSNISEGRVESPLRNAFPVVATDFIWILADGHWWKPPPR